MIKLVDKPLFRYVLSSAKAVGVIGLLVGVGWLSVELKPFDGSVREFTSQNALWLVIALLLFMLLLLLKLQLRDRDEVRHEKELQQTNEQYIALLGQSSEAMLIHDKGQIIYVNPAAIGLLGATEAEDLLHKPILGFVHPELQEPFLERLQSASAATLSIEQLPGRMVRFDGQPVDVETKTLPITYQDKAAFLLTLTPSPKAAETKKEKPVERVQEDFLALAENSCIGVCSIDRDFLFVEVNETLCNWLGCPKDELIGKSILKITAPDDVPESKELLHELFCANSPHARTEKRLITQNNDIIWCSVVLSAARNATGDISNVVGIIDNITARKKAEEVLQLSQFTCEKSGDAVFWMGSDARFIYVNNTACNLLGYSREELLTMRMCEICPALPEETWSAHRQNLKNSGVLTREASLRAKDGRGIPVETSEHFTEVSGMPFTCAFARDISNRKRTNERLRHLAAFPENNPHSVLKLAADGAIEYANPAFHRQLPALGVPLEQAHEVLPPDYLSCIQTCIDKQTAVSAQRQTRTMRTFRWEFYPVGGEAFVHCYGQEITELRDKESQLRKLSAAVTQSANIICITDAEGHIEFVNPRFCTITGYTPEEVLGQTPRILKSERNDRDLYEDLWRTIKAGHTWHGRIQNRKKNGEIYWERKTVSPIFNEEGDIINFVSLGEDISLELQTQLKLAENDKLSAIGTLAAGVAHEFKNYLGAIIGNASFAVEEMDRTKDVGAARDSLAKVIELGEKANDVAMSLLTYSTSKVEDLVSQDLPQVITKATALVEQDMKDRSIEIVTYFENPPPVEISPSKIQQLLLNLLINARHAIRSDGVVTIALTSNKNAVQVKVGDTGGGIPEKNLARIFDPFFSTKGVWGKDELVGTGMGLSICRNIARDHGGDLTVESLLGVGTTFTLTLPVAGEQSVRVSNTTAPTEGQQVLIFALQKSILSKYFTPACDAGVKLHWIDSITQVKSELAALADLVICDARFSGKVELYRMIELCRRAAIPYVMLNCGTMEYQLSDFYDHALANFKELPDFDRLLACFQSRPVVPD